MNSLEGPRSRSNTAATAATAATVEDDNASPEPMAQNVVTLPTARLPTPARVRTWINRLPFFARIILFVIVAAWLLSFLLPWLSSWGALVPSKVSLLSAHRLNTFPLVHSGTIPTIINILALIPLLERFESEHGTLVSLALFAGPFASLPGLLYILIDHVIFRADDTIQGASVWVCLLLACEAIKTYKANPDFTIGTYKIPTWATPVIVILFIHFLLPETSLLGHLCGAVVGYGFELGVLKFLVPPEKALRWIEGRLNLLGRLPHYVSIDQKTFGRYGVLPSNAHAAEAANSARSFMTGSSQRLGVPSAGP